jgi:hypothetical protein
MVAHSTVNRVVTGSSPVTGAKNKKGRFLLEGDDPFLVILVKFIFISKLLKALKVYLIKIIILK